MSVFFKVIIKEIGMKDAVQISMTDVINRLHHLKGEDRFHLIMEFMEWFCLEDEEILEYRGNN